MAKNKNNGKKVAIKEIRIPLNKQKELMIEREANALKELPHPNIVELIPPTYKVNEGPRCNFLQYLVT